MKHSFKTSVVDFSEGLEHVDLEAVVHHRLRLAVDPTRLASQILVYALCHCRTVKANPALKLGNFSLFFVGEVGGSSH